MKHKWVHASMVQSVVARHLSAAPLVDYHSPASPNTGGINWALDNVGWGLEHDREKLEKATGFFEARKDDWAIITQPSDLEDEDVEAYVKSNPKLKRSKIIVVQSHAMEGDETAPEWVVMHDIVGHSSCASVSADETPYTWALHAALPKQYRIAMKNPSDFLADICAAIFFHANLSKLVEDATDIYLAALVDRTSPAFRLREAWKVENPQSYGKERREDALDTSRADVKKRIHAQVNNLSNMVAKWTSQFKPGVPEKVYLW